MVGTKLGTVAQGTAGRFRGPRDAARGLRHKSRHKIPRGTPAGRAMATPKLSSREGRTLPETPLNPFAHAGIFYYFFFRGALSSAGRPEGAANRKSRERIILN